MPTRRATTNYEKHEVTTQDLIITDKRNRKVRFQLVPASALVRPGINFGHVVSIDGHAVTIGDEELRALLELLKETRAI